MARGIRSEFDRDMVRVAQLACRGPKHRRAIFWSAYWLGLVPSVPAAFLGALGRSIGFIADLWFLLMGAGLAKLEQWAYPGIREWASMFPPGVKGRCITIMAKSLKYGEIDIPGIPDDEPVFIGRSRDRLMVRQLEYYWMAARAQGCDDTHLTAIDAQRSAMVTYQLDHETKLPDSDPPDTEPEPGELPPAEAKVEDEPVSQGQLSGSSPE